MDGCEGAVRVAGVDEVGRGPWAGPVVAAAVVLDPSRPIDGLDDSKRLSAGRREALAGAIREQAWSWAVGRTEVAEIDALGIREAALRAMVRAVEGLQGPAPGHVIVDGRDVPEGLNCPAHAEVGADGSVAPVSAASILAKIVRDAEMVRLAGRYPAFGFDRNKGYGTAEHRRALERCGPTELHRRSFAPVRKMLRELDEQ